MDSSEIVNFQFYLKSVKEGSIPWDFFVSLMRDLCQTLANAKELNMILLNELRQYIDKDLPEKVKSEAEDEMEESLTNECLEVTNAIDSNDSVLIEEPNKEYTENSNSDENTSKDKISKDIIENISMNETKSGEIECKLCGKYLQDAKQFQSHMKINHLKNFECNHCNAKFGLKSRLNRHIDHVHFKIRPFKCKHCQMSFTTSTKMNYHIQTVHLKEYFIKCELCEKEFITNVLLKTHIKNFHGVKVEKYKCNVCNRQFTSEIIRNQHMKNHINPESFECEKCKAEFETLDHLKSHILKNHGIE